MVIKKNRFFPQVELVLQSLPYVFEEDVFALKGGSAINFFYRDMPRLSVDIDLTYLPIEPREISLKKMESALKRIAKRIRANLAGVIIQEGKIDNPDMVNKIFVKNTQAQIKIEPNLVIRGSVFPVEKRVLSSKAQETFELFVEVRTVSFADLFGGKICAALDRQHPRDIYDIKFLLDNETITEQIRKGFLIYLISHSRPIYELLDPVLKDFRDIYEAEFQGMTEDDVSYDDLVEVRKRLISIIRAALTQEEKEFLVSFEKGQPNWNLLGIDRIDNLPAVKWKLLNIRKMSEGKRTKFLKKMINSFER